MLTKLRRIEDHSENFNKKLENIKKESIRAEEYNNWKEKYTRENKKQIKW